jgi:hypothetical protein
VFSYSYFFGAAKNVLYDRDKHKKKLHAKKSGRVKKELILTANFRHITPHIYLLCLIHIFTSFIARGKLLLLILLSVDTAITLNVWIREDI